MTDITTSNTDIYKTITEKIIACMEKGTLPWRQPWTCSTDVMRPVRANHQAYSGVNILILWIAAHEKGYTSGHWLTIKQANKLNAKIRKGEKATQIVYADKFEKEVLTENGEKEIKSIPYLKTYNVFNADQIEGLPTAYYVYDTHKILNPDTKDETLEKFFASTGAEIVKGSFAGYHLIDDKIIMPPFEDFIDAPSYYATLGHEFVHFTRHKDRCNRDFGPYKFGNESYAKEELVAEIGSCFLGADLGFEPEFREDHAAYIQNWLDVLKNDKKFIFNAAAHAQKAVEFLHKLQS